TSLERKGKGNDSVAQLVEQYTFNVWVLGSSPSGITKSSQISFGCFFFVLKCANICANIFNA
ncbi:MAG: hypothetical protein RL747_870, partial [Bacteroidota bacterium]